MGHIMHLSCSCLVFSLALLEFPRGVAQFCEISTGEVLFSPRLGFSGGSYKAAYSYSYIIVSSSNLRPKNSVASHGPCAGYPKTPLYYTVPVLSVSKVLSETKLIRTGRWHCVILYLCNMSCSTTVIPAVLSMRIMRDLRRRGISISFKFFTVYVDNEVNFEITTTEQPFLRFSKNTS